MADGSKIEWTDATWNPITGCSVVSPGCTNCYAMRLAGTRMKHHPSREGLTEPSKKGPIWNGQVRFNEDWLHQPLKWQRRRLIFVCAHGDLFHENIPDAWIDPVFAVMAKARQHTFQVLTKRADRMRDYVAGVSKALGGVQLNARERSLRTSMLPWTTSQWPLPNVWLGVSAEDQTRADERIPDLLNTPAAVHWVSAEPLLGPIDLTSVNPNIDALKGAQPIVVDGAVEDVTFGHSLDWVVAGGESGPNARPMHPDWARGLRDQCEGAGVPFHFKQWGAWAPGECCPPMARTERVAHWWNNQWDYGRITPHESETMHSDDEPDVYLVGKKAAGRLLDGEEHNEFPEAA